MICINAGDEVVRQTSLGLPPQSARAAEFRKPNLSGYIPMTIISKHLQRCGRTRNPDTLCVFGALHNPGSSGCPHRQAHPGNPGKDTGTLSSDKLK
jgi:hypothetical protein